ncbi:germination protein YpeB [Metallumcola ferriviriculae]|uniref:Germination protein YpeB n=1 Tax=Metallumcola ferriviriculae TaxID=3039180 RepID=A0AAU0UKQ1_9FIRM|nr:germination protein YpeB [Desulfitibacteraceae bacterium MK1]
MYKKLSLVLTSVLVISLLGWGLHQYRSRRQIEQVLNAKYQQAFFNLLEHVEQSQVLLAKNLLTNSPDNQVTLLSDIWYESNSAQSSLGQLPVSQPFMDQTAKFLTQVGAYSQTLLGRVTLGNPLTPEQLDTLTAFHNNMGNLSLELQKMHRSLAEGNVTWQNLKKEAQEKLPEGETPPGEESFRTINQEIMQNQPVLIYDGPFSDHLEMTQPKGLTGKNISVSEAKQVLTSFTDLPVNNDGWRIKTRSNPGGKIPAYSFALTNGNINAAADISKTGGHVIWMTVSRSFAKPTLTPEQVKKAALSFMKERGFNKLTTSFMKLSRDTATVVLVPIEQDILIYPDQIKLEIALDNGQVTGYDALGYLMAHHRRNFPKALISKEGARSKLMNSFEVTGSRLALIPSASSKEVLAWEFRGKFHQDTFYIYINAVTGHEETIFQIFSSSQGQLAM